MPRYEVTVIERLVCRNTYRIEAETAEEAKELVYEAEGDPIRERVDDQWISSVIEVKPVKERQK